MATPLLAVAAVIFAVALHPGTQSGSAAAAQGIAAGNTTVAQPGAQAGRLCSSADLAVGVGSAGAYRNSATQELTLTNRAADACFIPGAPSITLLFDDGSRQTAAAGSFGTARVDLQPGQSALLLVGTPGTCSGAGPSQSNVATRLALGLPVGASLPVQGVYLDVQCGPSSVVLLTADGAPAAAGASQSAR